MAGNKTGRYYKTALSFLGGLDQESFETAVIAAAGKYTPQDSISRRTAGYRRPQLIAKWLEGQPETIIENFAGLAPSSVSGPRPEWARTIDFVASLAEPPADDVLDEAGATVATPRAWDQLGSLDRRCATFRALLGQEQSVKDALARKADSEERSAPTETSSEPIANNLGERVGLGEQGTVIPLLDVSSGPMVEPRLSDLLAIADYLARMSGAEANSILRAAKAGGVISPNWDSYSAAQKRGSLLEILREASNNSVSELQSLLPADELAGTEAKPQGQLVPRRADHDGPIFVVHGHDRAVLHEVVRVLERGTRREVIVLHEQPNAGRTILEKFEHHAVGASYAVVLLTADDEGGVASAADRRPRGRQNVIFELGFFFGKLGRDRVAVLLDTGVEKPSDIDGLVYIGIDPGGAWKHQLARELANAGLQIDYAAIP